jgi:hypothetical protein
MAMSYFDTLYGKPGVVTAFKPMHLPCGATAYFDYDSGISYICEYCMAVVGSAGQPQRCKDEIQKYDNWEELGGKGWDYDKGCSK